MKKTIYCFLVFFFLTPLCLSSKENRYFSGTFSSNGQTLAIYLFDSRRQQNKICFIDLPSGQKKYSAIYIEPRNILTQFSLSADGKYMAYTHLKEYYIFLMHWSGKTMKWEQVKRFNLTPTFHFFQDKFILYNRLYGRNKSFIPVIEQTIYKMKSRKTIKKRMSLPKDQAFIPMLSSGENKLLLFVSGKHRSWTIYHSHFPQRPRLWLEDMKLSCLRSYFLAQGDWLLCDQSTIDSEVSLGIFQFIPDNVLERNKNHFGFGEEGIIALAPGPKHDLVILVVKRRIPDHNNAYSPDLLDMKDPKCIYSYSIILWSWKHSVEVAPRYLQYKKEHLYRIISSYKVNGCLLVFSDEIFLITYPTLKRKEELKEQEKAAYQAIDNVLKRNLPGWTRSLSFLLCQFLCYYQTPTPVSIDTSF